MGSHSNCAVLPEKEASDPGTQLCRVLLIAHYFPPGTSSGTLRTVKFARYLPEFGWAPQILTMTPEAYHPSRRDQSLLEQLAPSLKVHRTAVWMPDRVLARWMRRLRDLRPSRKSRPAEAAKPLAGWHRVKKRRPIIDDLVDWMHFPDDYGGWLIPGLWKGWRVARQERPQLLYSSSPSPVSHMIAAGLKSLTGLPWVADFRDPWEAVFPECIYLEEENRWKRAAEVAVAERVIGRADLIVANTELACQAFRERFPQMPADRFTDLPNGFDVEDFHGVTPTQTEGRKFSILHAGTFFTGLRTPEELLETVKEMVAEGSLDASRVQVQLVGCGAFSRPDVPALEVIPRVGHAESLRMMADADVLFLPQQSPKYRLMIPAKTYEYMAAKKWILAIAPEESATANLVRRMPNGVVVNPGDRQGLRDALLRFYRLFLERRLYPVPQDSGLMLSFTRREQTRVLAHWFDRLLQEPRCL